VNEEAFFALIRARRSVRRYATQPVTAELVDKLLEAAHWAPSAHNRQPWRFVLLNDLALRRRLAEAMAAHWQADLLADGADPAAVDRRAALSIERITDAPLAILPCLDQDSLDFYPDPQRQQNEWQMGVQSVALACQNLLLAAQQLGLVACWMCAPIFCPGLVRTVLDLPPTLEPQALLTIGYPPDDAPRNKERAPLTTRVVVR
jgi:F420 biosynthesis protein FbiB-like protein